MEDITLQKTHTDDETYEDNPPIDVQDKKKSQRKSFGDNSDFPYQMKEKHTFPSKPKENEEEIQIPTTGGVLFQEQDQIEEVFESKDFKQNEEQKEQKLVEEDKVREEPEEKKEIVIPKPINQKSKDSEERVSEIQAKRKKKILQRKNSKFEIQEQSANDQHLYRPEFVYGTEEESAQKNDKLWDLMSSYLGNDTRSIQRQIVNHIEYTLAMTRFNFDKRGCYQAAAYSIRDRLLEAWNDTNQHFYPKDPKRVYYLSLEFLLGRMMQNALVNLDLEKKYKEALFDLGFKLEEIYEEEVDPALGNGGLGRLAACFLDSLASLDYPAWGYGIRYNYGIFKQEIHNGYQVEVPDYWLTNGNPWEIERTDVIYHLGFYGKVVKFWDGGVERSKWEPDYYIQAMAYDTPIPGYNTFNTNNLRLWKSCPVSEFDFKSFSSGDYFKCVQERQRAEYISSVLYPDDSKASGKKLRLKQQYFFCAATLKDVIRRFWKVRNRKWEMFPDKVAIQLNDTHPAISIIELFRILIDEHKLTFEEAWNITHKTFAYTNHTVLPEALERWSVDMMGELLPRHLELIYLFNHLFLEKVKRKYPGNVEKMRSMSLIEEATPKMIRMANLCVVASHAVNGVAAMHSELVKHALFPDFYEMFPNKFQNKTNGVTPRRWVYCCNAALADLLTKQLGHSEWVKDLELLEELRGQVDSKEFHEHWAHMKLINKERLAKYVEKNHGIKLNTNSLFDIQVKRIHEYKRQLMNIFYVIHRYLKIKKMSPEERKNVVPRTIFIGGKAAPGYVNAKHIIKLFNSVANTVNNDPDIGEIMKCVYFTNYCVSNAQIIIPAADLSQHISTAGTEASGTSNMKFAMNGCLIIGTMDGANVEIAEEIGTDNMFIFGLDVNGVNNARRQMHEGKRDYVGPRLNEVFDAIFQGRFGNLKEMHDMLGRLKDGGDFYLVCWDFYDYINAQERVDACYKNPSQWFNKSITSVASMGKFSSDRTINEYAKDIWNVEPISVPKPSMSEMARIRSFPALVV